MAVCVLFLLDKAISKHWMKGGKTQSFESVFNRQSLQGAGFL
jgi:hypothetical protein